MAQAYGMEEQDAGGRPGMLVVADRREDVAAIGATLRTLDADVYTVSSAVDALHVPSRCLAAVLIDVHEADPVQTAAALRAHQPLRGVPFVVVATPGQVADDAGIGPVDFLPPPAGPEMLRRKARLYLDLHAQREKILRLNGILTRSNEELERFAYACSHDLQEPVRMMGSFARLLESQGRGVLDESGERYLGFIIGNARHMQSMIQDILAFSRAGREEIRLELVDCGEVARDVVRTLQPAIVESGGRVVIGTLPSVRTNMTLVRVLFQNLIGNALKFQDGTHTPEVHVGAAREGSLWRISVRDNGIGIDPAFRHRVFTAFQRFHGRDDYPGTGIGLSTCRRLVRQCGGDIGFYSTPDGGTTFTFTLPAGEPA